MLKQIFKIEDLETIYNSCADEKETTINIVGSSNIMELYTSDNSMVTKMKKIMLSNPGKIECYEAGICEGKVTGYFFKLDKKHLSFRQSVDREMSEEFKNAAKERMSKLAAEGKLGRKKTNNENK